MPGQGSDGEGFVLKKVLLALCPFVLVFLIGCALVLRPPYPARVVEVVDAFARQEKTGQRSTHRKTVYYATVRVELDGVLHDVTVHEPTWKPLKVGDSVTVARSFGGRIVEYSTKNGYILMAFSALSGALALWILKRDSREKKRTDRAKEPLP